jgi:hypothetical protein
VAEFGGQLEPRHYGFHPEIQVDEDGVKWAVTTNDIPASANDFAACTRSVLSDMPVSEDLIRKGAEELNVQRAQASAAQRSLMGSPVVIVVAGVAIVVSELVLEAGAYTIMFAVTVKVVEKAVDDVADALKKQRNWKDECSAHFALCSATNVVRQDGNHWQQTRCGICARVCVQTEGSWPSEVGNGSCEYWLRGWK